MTDPYRVLGVARDADQAEVRRVFKKLAREYHPDRNPTPEAEARFKEISAAYEVLGDEEKRKLYDEFGEVSLKPGFNAEQARAWGRRGGGFPGGGFPGGGFPGGGVDFSDIFGDFFGAGGRGPRRAPRPVKGDDIRAELTVDLVTALRGGELAVQVRRPLSTGQLESATLKVRVPPGIEDGQTLRLRGRGGGSPSGGPPGDVVLTLRVSDHPALRRVGDDLELDLPLRISEAVEGARVEVPTPWGRFKVTVPPGSQSGQRLRLRGKGVPEREGRAAGDLFLVLRPTPPRAEDAELVELARAMDRFYAADPRADLDFPPVEPA